MRRIVAAIQNILVLEAILNALNKHGLYAEKALSSEPQKVASLCKSLFADILIMDVSRFGNTTFDNRVETINEVKNQNPKIKICFVFDNESDNELAFKILDAKEIGQIDAFFYQSVPSDYIADVISTM